MMMMMMMIVAVAAVAMRWECGGGGSGNQKYIKALYISQFIDVSIMKSQEAKSLFSVIIFRCSMCRFAMCFPK